MKRLFLEIDEKEKNRILELHSNFKNNLILEYGGFFKTLGVGASRATRNALKNSPEFMTIMGKKGYKNADEFIDALIAGSLTLTKKESGALAIQLFKATDDAAERAILASRFVDEPAFINKYIKGTEEATIQELKTVGKYTDEQAASLINAYKKKPEIALGGWTNVVRNKGQYKSLEGLPGWKETVINAEKATGKPFGKLGQGTREKLIRDFFEQSLKKGNRLSWKELYQLYKTELKTAGITATALISLGLYNYLKEKGVDDLPPQEEIVVTDTETNTTQNLGDRILKRGSRGSDVKELQTKLIEAGFDVGNSGDGTGVDGIFGKVTANAVREFQAEYNTKAPEGQKIKVDGIYGPQSHEALINYKPSMEYTPGHAIFPKDVKELTPKEVKQVEPNISISSEDVVIELPKNITNTKLDDVIPAIEKGRKKCPSGKKRYIKKTIQNNKENKIINVYGCK